MYLFVAILEKVRHLGFLIGRSDRIDLTTLEMTHANFGAYLTICTIHPQMHTNSSTLTVLYITTYPNVPKENVTTCPTLFSLTKFVVIVNRCTPLPYTQRLYTGHSSVCIHRYEHVYKSHLECFCRAWEDSRDFTSDMLKCNTNILQSCGNICISRFRCGAPVTTCTCYNQPQSLLRIRMHVWSYRVISYFTSDMLKCDTNILQSCGNVYISRFRCGASVTTCTCYNQPQSLLRIRMHVWSYRVISFS